MTRHIAAALAAACAAALAVAAPALAQAPDSPRDLIRERHGGLSKPYPQINLKGSNGYKISISEWNPDEVVLVAQKGRKLAAVYRTEGQVKRKLVRAKFGSLGKIDVTFTKKGKTKKRKPKGCTGTADRIQPGVWKGTIRFKGENGYTKVNVSQAKGGLVRSGGYICGSPPGGGDEPELYLGAMRTTPKEFVGLSVSKRYGVPSARPVFDAFVDEQKGKVSITRYAWVRGKPNQFTGTLEPPTASVSPPSPFKGSAELADEVWSGNLKVKMPGRTVKLTGPGFTAEVYLLNLL